MRVFRTLAKLPAVMAVALALCALPVAAVAAQSSQSLEDAKKVADSTDSKAMPQPVNSVLQGHSADAPIRPGTIVQLIDKAKLKVTPATLKKADQTYGVVITTNNLPLTITDEGLTNELYVAQNGTYDVFVSTQNGDIKAGDYITVSAIDGIGMVALPGQNVTVVGRAAEPFDGKANVLGSVQLKDEKGHDAQKVLLGSVAVAIDIRDNPKEKSTKANVPDFLERIGEAVAEKPVSPVRIYLSIGITGFTVVVALSLLYAGVRNAVISIGRNPLSRRSIVRTLIEIILAGFIILIIGLFAVYLLLKL